MTGICLLVAGVVRASLPGPEFTLAWDHSVEKIEWRERYAVDGERLRLVEARVLGNGAGMEPPPDAIRDGSGWTWRPDAAPLRELRLTWSTFTRDYRLCGSPRCSSLAETVGPLADGDVVTVRVCR